MEYTHTLLCGLIALTALRSSTVSGRTATLRLDPTTNMKCRPMSPTVAVLMESEGNSIQLTLRKDEQDLNVPMYSIRDGIVLRASVPNISHEAMYKDRENKASMKVECFNPPEVGVFVRLTGTVLMNGEMWVVRPNLERSNSDPLIPIVYDMEISTRPDFGSDAKSIFATMTSSSSTGESASSTTVSPTDRPYDEAVPLNRRKRASDCNSLKLEDLTKYNVDVLAVIDYSIYSQYFDWSSKSTDTLKRTDALVAIKRYFAHVFNGISLRYDDILGIKQPIVVRLIGYIVTEDVNNAPWTEPYKEYDYTNQRYTVDADIALGKLKEWKASSADLPEHDHLMLFTRFDLTTTVSGVKGSGVVGYAYTSAVCSEFGVSVIEESFDRFEGTTATAAHELAHSLGALHDGQNNICWKDERFLMWPSITSINTYHNWEFSHCSISYFNYFFDNLVKTNAGLCCMMNSPTPEDVTDVTGTLQGQELTFDEQCEIGLGPTSKVCLGLTALETLCGLLYCTIPSNAGYCSAIYPALGSHCGANKWCRGGQCVETDDSNVPAEKCPFDETATNLANTGRNCSDYVNTYGGAQCYSSSIVRECCKTCEEYETGITGCEYGNRLEPCEFKFCDPALNETLKDGTAYVEVCCGTCGYTTANTTIATTTVGGHITITFKNSGARSLSWGLKHLLLLSSLSLYFRFLTPVS